MAHTGTATDVSSMYHHGTEGTATDASSMYHHGTEPPDDNMAHTGTATDASSMYHHGTEPPDDDMAHTLTTFELQHNGSLVFVQAWPNQSVGYSDCGWEVAH
jgi:hypothetical protein